MTALIFIYLLYIYLYKIKLWFNSVRFNWIVNWNISHFPKTLVYQTVYVCFCRYVRNMAVVSAHTAAVGRVWNQPSPLQQRPVRPAHLDAIPLTHRYRAHTEHTPAGDPSKPSEVIFLGQWLLKLSVVNAVIGLLFLCTESTLALAFSYSYVNTVPHDPISHSVLF